MKNILNVAWFSIKTTIRKKSFLISNIIILAIIFIIFNVINFLFGSYVLSNPNDTVEVASTSSNFTSADTYHQDLTTSSSPSAQNDDKIIQVEIEQKNSLPPIFILDEENILGDYVEKLPSSRFIFSLTTSNIEDIKENIRNGIIYSAIRIYHDDNNIKFDYLAYEESSLNTSDADYILKEINKIYLQKFADENNLSEAMANEVMAEFSYSIEPVTDTPVISITVIVGLAISMMLFMAIYMYGHSISLSIASEKDSRVIETLVTSSTPTQIIVGKTLGMGILGLVQLLVIILFSVFCYSTYIPEGIDIVSLYLSDINLNINTIIIICIYFVLGYTLYAFLNAIAGAIVNKAEEVQSASLPLYFISMICFYMSIFTIDSNSDKLNSFVQMFPLSSPFSMPAKLVVGLVSNTEIISSLFILLLTTLLFVFIAIRIYSVAILHYGNKLKIKDLFNIFLKFK